MTITEALAEIKTVQKRIDAKRAFIKQYLFRQDYTKDPLEKDGGSEKAIAAEFQAVADLEKRIVDLRHGIQKANEETKVTLEGVERSISDWLTWRRDVAPIRQNFLSNIRLQLTNVRDQARKQGASLFGPGSQPEKPTDVIVNINETQLAKDIEQTENILGQLDGQLSLKNATVQISI